jgi:Mg2+ and Co2+ transporter CorA
MTIIIDISLDMLEEILEDSRPRLEDFAADNFILFKSVTKHATEIERKREYQCGLVIEEKIVISIHLGIPIPLPKLFRRFRRNIEKFVLGKTTHLVSTYLDSLIDLTYDVIDGWRKVSDEVEWKILHDKKFEESDTISRLIELRESIFDTVKILQADREVVNKMHSPAVTFFQKQYIAPELDDHIRHLLDEQDILRITISDLMSLYFNAEARKTNNTLARFTFVTSLLLFPNLIASIFGMNNIGFPAISFWWVIGFMVLSMFILWLIFKKSKLI